MVAAPSTNGHAQPPASLSRQGSSFFGTAKDAAQAAFAVVNQAASPLPTTPDGLTNLQAKAPTDAAPTNGLLKGLFNDILAGRVDENAATALQAISEATGGPIDDRKMLLENIVDALSKMSPESSAQGKATGALVELLWNDLTHPASSYVGPKHRFRSGDGSGNSLQDPQFGAANTPYARSVGQSHPPPNNLPDPTVVFDALLKREEFKPHPSGISSLLFSFATLIIHSCFQTSRTDPSINEASSYLDLSPLYGNNDEEIATVRSFQNGELWPDVAASDRLQFMPPSVMALLLVFNRNHNFIAHKLLAINERGRFVPWTESPKDDAERKAIEASDEEIFQTARLVNCGAFLNCIVGDYIRCILNLNQTESLWSLLPTSEIRNLPSGMAPRGTGNAVSVEFNILYRWHAAISKQDEEWLEGVFTKILGDEKPFDELTKEEFGFALRQLDKNREKDPRKVEFGDIKRDPTTGRFKDEDLVRLLKDATDNVAGAFGAKSSPACMRIIDVIGIASARNDWNTCSLNEFRRFLNLKPFTKFEEWNSDPKIAKIAEQLYVHPENLELFVGLHAEQAKPSQDASGLAPGYTISRAILSDAVALTRGDRFYTTDYNSGSLTSWGFQDVSMDTAGGSYGGVLGKLLMRAFPNHYKFNSIYAFFAFSTPATTRAALTKFGKLDQYDFSDPTDAPAVKSVKTYAACVNVLADSKRFGVYYGPAIQQLCKNNRDFFIGTDNLDTHKRDRQIMSSALFPDGWAGRLFDFYSNKTAELITKSSFTYDGGKTRMLDVVRDVTNMVPVHWTSAQFGMPIKTDDTPFALFTPKELYLMLSAFFISVFMNFDPASGFKLKAAAAKPAKLLHALIDARIAQTNGTPELIMDLAAKLQKLVVGKEVEGLTMGTEATAFYRRLLKGNTRPTDELNASVQCTMTASVANQGQAAAQIINFYLQEERRAEYLELCRLSQEDSDEVNVKIRAYIFEALRLDPQVPFIPRVVKEDAEIQDGGRVVSVKAGDFLFPSIKNSGLDELVYPNPHQVDITRDFTKFRGFGGGIHECLGARICHQSLVAMIKEVFKLKNVRRAPGPAGQLKRVWQTLAETQVPVYITPTSTLSPLPPSLSIVWDDM